MNNFRTMQELVESLHTLGDETCLLWFEEEHSEKLSYADFAKMAAAVARSLAGRNLGPGGSVGVFAENRWQIVLLAAGITASGATVVPLDPQFSGEVLAHVLRDSEPSLLLASGPQEEAVQDAMGKAPCPVLLTDEEEGERSWRVLLHQEGAEPGCAAPEDVVALFYTSGTTGRPKGVPLSHANLVFQQRALIDSGLTSKGDRMLLPLPLHHVYPYVVGVFAPFALGLTIILPRAVTGGEILRAIREGRATIVVGIPRLYEALVKGVMDRLGALGFFARRLMLGLLGLSRFMRRRLGIRTGRVLLAGLHRRLGPDLKIMASGGAPLDHDLAWTMEALGWRVAIGYGLTETSPILCVNPPGAGHFESVGMPLPGVELRMATVEQEEDDGAAVLEGGEVQARGPGVFQGYRNLQDKTAEAFTTDGWFRTGDVGRMEDGRLVLSGRVSTMIVTQGGENVQPDAVEQVLERHPFVRECGVLEREGKIAVLAVPDMVAARNAGLEPEDAARRGVSEAAKGLPSYQRPAQVAVSATGLERTRLGKIRRHKLEEHFDRVVHGGEELDLSPMQLQEMAAADRRLLEHDAAAGAWALLAERYPQRRLTPDSDLAGDMGVDSLEWLDLSLELRERSGVELQEEHITAMNSVRDLLRTVISLQGQEQKRSDPVDKPDEYLTPEDKRWLTPVTGARLGFYRFLHVAAGGLARGVFRIQVQGLEHLETEGPLVLTPNHLSYLDPVLLGAALPFDFLRRTHFIGWQGAAFANSLLAFFSRTAQTIPIDPARRPGTSLALGAGVIEKGRNMIWFPEGMRSPNGELLRFQPGLGRILATGKETERVKVLPVAIYGTLQALPKGRWWIKPVQVRFEIGEPVAVAELQQGAIKTDGGGCETPAECVMRNLRERLQAMLSRE